MSAQRILLIDDDPDFVELLKLRLEAHQYAVSTALSGEAGLKKARHDRPDLIVVDMVLPTNTGLAVLQDLKMHPQTFSIPVILVTGDEGAAAVLNALDYKKTGTVTHLIKPVSSEELLAAVERALSHHEADTSTPRDSDG